MHFSLVKIMAATPAIGGFDDVILPVYYALKRLGFSVEVRDTVNPQSRNIIFGSGNIAKKPESATLPPDSIIFNLEQFTTGSPWVFSEYMQHLALYNVWDYSPRNVTFLKRLGISNVSRVRLGYVPEMTRLNVSGTQDIDVLFYGALNYRRKIILQKLAKAGVKVKRPRFVYGATRDAWLTRSKIVLNMHFYAPASLEVPRLGYLWANKKTVLSECNWDTEHDLELAAACRYCDYHDLVQATIELLADSVAQKKQAEDGFAAFSSISLEGELKALVGSRIFSFNAVSHPDHSHAKPSVISTPEVSAPIQTLPPCGPGDNNLDFSKPHLDTVLATLRPKRNVFVRVYYKFKREGCAGVLKAVCKK